MQKKLLYVVWIMLFLAACNAQNTEREITPTTENYSSLTCHYHPQQKLQKLK